MTRSRTVVADPRGLPRGAICWASYESNSRMRGVQAHLENYHAPRMQKHVVRILWMPCTYGLDAWFALRFKHSAIYLDTLRECYEAFVIVRRCSGGSGSSAFARLTLSAAVPLFHVHLGVAGAEGRSGSHPSGKAAAATLFSSFSLSQAVAHEG